jgi:hypothetical protein
LPRDRAARNRDTIARKMAPDEISRAQELARLWKPKQERESQE